MKKKIADHIAAMLIVTALILAMSVSDDVPVTTHCLILVAAVFTVFAANVVQTIWGSDWFELRNRRGKKL